MMKRETPWQSVFFNYAVNLEDRIPRDHELRQVSSVLNLDFMYEQVKDKYGHNGNESVPPPVILKLMLLLIFYNVRSERELMRTLPYRMDWLWFLGYGLDTVIPNHSVLSKARFRWGESVFKELFERIVHQCVELGLVDGKKLFMDSSLVDANASRESVVDMHSLSAFTFDPESDTYICPAGKRLRLKTRRLREQRMYYAARADDCNACELKSQCTRSATGRTIQRYDRQDDLEEMRAMAKTPKGKQDLKTRQHLMERSFAYSVPLGFKRARWRRLWRVQIQEYLTASIQNIKRMIQHLKKSIRSNALKVVQRFKNCLQASTWGGMNLSFGISI